MGLSETMAHNEKNEDAAKEMYFNGITDAQTIANKLNCPLQYVQNWIKNGDWEKITDEYLSEIRSIYFEKYIQMVFNQFNEGKTRDQIIDEFVTKGTMKKEAAKLIVGTVAEQMTDIKHEGKAAEQNQSESSWNGGGSLAIGLVILIGGIIATAASKGQVLFYGAIGVGVIYIIKGAIGK